MKLDCEIVKIKSAITLQRSFLFFKNNQNKTTNKITKARVM